MEFLNALGCRISSVKTENRHFFFSAFLSTFNASIVNFCTILLPTTIHTSCSHSITFVFNLFLTLGIYTSEGAKDIKK